MAIGACTAKARQQTGQATNRRTRQAIAKGHLDLERRTVHTGIWFPLRRPSSMTELSAIALGSPKNGLPRRWDDCGQPSRGGLTGQPLEGLPWAKQSRLPTGAAHHRRGAGRQRAWPRHLRKSLPPRTGTTHRCRHAIPAKARIQTQRSARGRDHSAYPDRLGRAVRDTLNLIRNLPTAAWECGTWPT